MPVLPCNEQNVQDNHNNECYMYEKDKGRAPLGIYLDYWWAMRKVRYLYRKPM